MSDSWFRLRSWSQGPWVQALCQSLYWQCGACLGFSLSLSLSAPSLLSLSKWICKLKKKQQSSPLRGNIKTAVYTMPWENRIQICSYSFWSMFRDSFENKGAGRRYFPPLIPSINTEPPVGGRNSKTLLASAQGSEWILLKLSTGHTQLPGCKRKFSTFNVCGHCSWALAQVPHGLLCF